jgi:protein-S-isoprenylcysteine O-methyltransferase Ste14
MDSVARSVLPCPYRETPLTRAGLWLFVRRGWLPWLVLPLLAVPSRSEMRSGWSSVVAVCFWLGLGESIRVWAVGYAGSRTRTRARSGRLKDLVTGGPYAHVRNPIYLGNCLLAVGILLLFDRWGVAMPLLLAVLLCYHLVVLWEEQLLGAAFGEGYRRYRCSVPRWVPRLRRYAACSNHRFSWKQVLTSERGTFVTLALVFLLYAARECVEAAMR